MDPESLLDACARSVSSRMSLETLERVCRPCPVPDPVQKRIIFWAFPRDERQIRIYSSLATNNDDNENNNESAFHAGNAIVEQQRVKEVLQVGFHLSGTILGANPSNVGDRIKVSLSFDRCTITSVSCSCGSKDIFWCSHAVALALFRLRNANSIDLRLPISESLLRLNRDQLQKVVQYLVAEHGGDVLPSAQRLADRLLDVNDAINTLDGAPDPTAGSGPDQRCAWHLDAEQVGQQVRLQLGQLEVGGGGRRRLHAMLAKVREMLHVRDPNGVHMMAIITENFVDANSNNNDSNSNNNEAVVSNDPLRALWDQIALLWVSIVLNPKATATERQGMRTRLSNWARMHNCPLEDPEHHRANRAKRRRASFSSSEDENEEESDVEEENFTENMNFLLQGSRKRGRNRCRKPRSIFHRALDALKLDWSGDHLQRILAHTRPAPGTPSSYLNDLGQFVWREPLPWACARIEALKTHGYAAEALRLSVAVVRNLMWQQQQQLEQWTTTCNNNGDIVGNTKGNTIELAEGWIGHPLNPVGCLFDTLANAAVSSSPNSSSTSRTISTLNESFKRSSKSASNSTRSNRRDTYLTLALEAALIGLGQQRRMPVGLYLQELASVQEKRLLMKLQHLKMDAPRRAVLMRQAHLQLNSGPSSGLSTNFDVESVPLQAFARFMFLAILPFDSHLAFRVGLRAMRLPVVKANVENNGVPKWYTLGEIEMEQCLLALNLISHAKTHIQHLDSVLESCSQHIHSPSQLFKVAQESIRLAMPTNQESENSAISPILEPRHQPMLNVAFQLGRQTLKMTLHNNWRRRREIVQWVVGCAVEVGLEAVMSLLQKWKELFTPVEATGSVATTLLSANTLRRLTTDFVQQKELSSCARTLAIHSAREDPSNCALFSLTLCESEPIAFETVYQIVIDAADAAMSSSQLFAIGRYMEHRGHLHRAYHLALLAMKTVRLGYNQDAHPAINDINWAVALSRSLGQHQLSTLIPLLVRNVECAVVLADILRTCSASLRLNAKSSESITSPLHQLLDAALAAFVHTTHLRLSNISPRHYSEFIEFLTKARATFVLSADGIVKFANLLDSVKITYKGKKKLISLVKERFG